MRTTRRRRRKQMTSVFSGGACSPESPISPRNLTREFNTMSSSDEENGGVKNSTPYNNSDDHRDKNSSQNNHVKSSNRMSRKYGKTYAESKQSARFSSKSVDETDDSIVRKKVVEEFVTKEYSKKVITNHSSQNQADNSRFKTPPRDDSLLDGSK